MMVFVENPERTTPCTQVWDQIDRQRESQSPFRVARAVFPCANTFPMTLRNRLRFLRAFTPMRRRKRNNSRRHRLVKAIEVEGQPILFEVSQGHRTKKHELNYKLHSDRSISARVKRAAENRLSFFLGTDDDLAPFYARVAQDPPVAAAATRVRGLHQVKFSTPFESACWGVLNQRVGMSVARGMKNALVKHGRLSRDASTAWSFGRSRRLARWLK